MDVMCPTSEADPGLNIAEPLAIAVLQNGLRIEALAVVLDEDMDGVALVLAKDGNA